MMSFLLALLKERQSKKRRLRPAPAGQCHGRRPAGEVPPLLTPPLQARLVTASVILPLLYLALRDPPRLDPARPAAAVVWPAAAGTGATPRRGFCSPGPLGGGWWGETGAPLRSHLGAMKILPQNGFITADYAWLPQNTANYDFVKRITTDY
jgi:hypothetical protein